MDEQGAHLEDRLEDLEDRPAHVEVGEGPSEDLEQMGAGVPWAV